MTQQFFDISTLSISRTVIFFFYLKFANFWYTCFVPNLIPIWPRSHGLFWGNQSNNNTDFTFKFHFLLSTSLLGYNKIDKKKSSAVGIVESRSKEM